MQAVHKLVAALLGEQRLAYKLRKGCGGHAVPVSSAYGDLQLAAPAAVPGSAPSPSHLR